MTDSFKAFTDKLKSGEALKMAKEQGSMVYARASSVVQQVAQSDTMKTAKDSSGRAFTRATTMVQQVPVQSSLRVAKEQGSKLMSTTGSYVYSAASKVASKFGR